LEINVSRIVIALGGNALGNNPEEQKQMVLTPAKQIARLVKDGNTVIVGHGNGPQVGMIFNAFADAKKVNPKTPSMPFAEAGGMSQGYIGYHMQTAITNCLKQLGCNQQTLYVLTQTIVDPNDQAFHNPTKPVGPFFASAQEATNIYGKDATIIEDAGRGYRKVVPSPKPINFVSIDAIKAAVDHNDVVIAGGGGGIPTIIDANNQYVGVDGVIDKDFALSKMAQIVNADLFIILTAVKKVYVNFNKPDQKALDVINLAELKQYIDQNQFAKGSMLPKVQAAIDFVTNNPHAKAIIADINDLQSVLEPNSNVGTTIVAK